MSGRELKEELIDLLEEKARRAKLRKILTMYPDSGPLRRELYPKHLEFFSAGKTRRERALIAANRIGKTTVACYEAALHLTGLYPEWWPGRRFDRPVRVWVAGKTNETTRDIIQRKLFGDIQWVDGKKSFAGNELIPGESIGEITWKAGVPDLADQVRVSHVSGVYSTLGLKSYQQGRGAFEGTEQDVIILDEEPEQKPLEIYTECLIRTMTCQGLVMLTFTPLNGYSDVVESFLDDKSGNKYTMEIQWDDNPPHLTEKDKAELLASIPPWERDARTKGRPSVGSGAIYPVSEDDITCAPFEIPKWWGRGYALDVGWNMTAALWGALDPETDILYLYSEYYKGKAEPEVHAAGLKSRGEHLRGVIDPAARGRSQKDGSRLYEIYRDLGLHLTIADNTIEAGIYDVWSRLSTGKLKVFKGLGNFLKEYHKYRRDLEGKIIKKDDHLMDCLRYLVRSGVRIMRQRQSLSEIMGVHIPTPNAVEYDPFDNRMTMQ